MNNLWGEETELYCQEKNKGNALRKIPLLGVGEQTPFIHKLRTWQNFLVWVSLLHKLKYNKQKIIEHLLLVGSKVSFYQRVTKPRHVLLSNSFIERTTNLNWRKGFWIQLW